MLEPNVTPYPTGILPVDMEQFDAEQVTKLNKALSAYTTEQTPAPPPTPCIVTDFETGIAKTATTKECNCP